MALAPVEYRNPVETIYSLLVDVMSGPTYDENATVEMRAAYIALCVLGAEPVSHVSEEER